MATTTPIPHDVSASPIVQDPERSRRGLPHLDGTVAAILGATIVAIPILSLASSLRTTLRDPTFLSGWTTTLTLAALVLVWWRRTPDAAALRRRIDTQLFTGGTFLAMLTVHVGFQIPNGWIGGALAALSVALTASLVVGLILVRTCAARRRTVEDDPALTRWLFAHSALSCALLGLGCMHGVFVHTHGLGAYLMLGK